MLNRIHTYLSGALNESVEQEPPKTYPRYQQIPLPKPKPITTSSHEMFAGRESTRSFERTCVETDALSEVLYYGAGVNERHTKKFHPSGGTLYPLEVYVVCNPAYHDEREPVLYHYVPETHTLEAFPETKIPFQTLTETIAGIEDLKKAPIYVFITAKWANSYKRYQMLGYKLTLMEAGHAMQNMQLAACASGFAACPFLIADIQTANTFLDIDRRENEDFVYALALGYPKQTR